MLYFAITSFGVFCVFVEEKAHSLYGFDKPTTY